MELSSTRHPSFCVLFRPDVSVPAIPALTVNQVNPPFFKLLLLCIWQSSDNTCPAAQGGHSLLKKQKLRFKRGAGT